jgi:hypothetical protein
MFRSCSTESSLAIVLPNRSEYKLVLSEFECKSPGLYEKISSSALEFNY